MEVSMHGGYSKVPSLGFGSGERALLNWKPL